MTDIERAIVIAIPLFVPVVAFAVMHYRSRLLLAFLRLVAWACERMGRVRYIPERPKCPHCSLGGHGRSGTCAVCRGRGTVPHSDPYLTRYVLWGRVHDDVEGRVHDDPGPWGINVWLHRIYRPDADRHAHDHPWTNSGGIVLAGGYDEARQNTGDNRGEYTLRYLSAGAVTLLPRGVYHRIVSVESDTWTLFVTGSEHGTGWGFLVDGVHVDSDVYLHDLRELAIPIDDDEFVRGEAIAAGTFVGVIPITDDEFGPDTERTEPATPRTLRSGDGRTQLVPHPVCELAAQALEREGSTVKRRS